MAGDLNNLALLYNAEARYAEAEPLYNAEARYAEAEPLYKRSLGILEKTLVDRI